MPVRLNIVQDRFWNFSGIPGQNLLDKTGEVKGLRDTDTVTLFLGCPGIWDGSFVAFLGGTDIEMESGEVLQGEVQFPQRPQVNGLDILVTLITEVDPIGLLSLGIEIVKRPQLLIIAEGADHPIDSPLISTIGTEEKSFPNLFFQ